MEPHTTISSKTLEKLMNDEFKTFEELEEFESSLEFSDTSKINILYRMVDNDNRQEEVFIIETIFINE